MTRRLGPFIAVFAVTVLFVASTVRGQEELTNVRVVEMTKLGLEDDVVVAKIKSGKCSFQLADSDLIDLKKAGVSAKVVAAMLEASTITAPRLSIDGKDLELHTLAQAKVGGRLGNFMTAGLKSVKWKAYLQGGRAAVSAGATPKISIELPRNQSVEDFLLVAMDPKDDRREIEVASGGGTVGAKGGLKAEAIIQTAATPRGGNKFDLTVNRPLKQGSYLFYVVGSADTTKGLYGKGYDFDVR